MIAATTTNSGDFASLILHYRGKLAIAALALSGCHTGPPPRAPSRPGGGLVRMHVEADEPGTILNGATVCPAPCDRPIDGQKGQEFFFIAPGIPESRHFQILDLSGDVNARVDGGSRLRQTGGYAMIGLGGFGIFEGVESIVTGALIRAYGKEKSTKDIGKSFQLGGYIALGVGATLIGTGIAIAYSGATTVELTPQGGRVVGRF